MGKVYATVADIKATGRSLTQQQEDAAENLLKSASAKLRITASKYGKSIDALIDDDMAGEDYAEAVKSVIIQSVLRSLDSTEVGSNISQTTQSGLGYSAGVTFINAGQSLYFLRNELRELGLMRQRYGAMGVYITDDATD